MGGSFTALISSNWWCPLKLTFHPRSSSSWINPASTRWIGPLSTPTFGYWILIFQDDIRIVDVTSLKSHLTTTIRRRCVKFFHLYNTYKERHTWKDTRRSKKRETSTALEKVIGIVLTYSCRFRLLDKTRFGGHVEWEKTNWSVVEVKGRGNGLRLTAKAPYLKEWRALWKRSEGVAASLE